MRKKTPDREGIVRVRMKKQIFLITLLFILRFSSYACAEVWSPEESAYSIEAERVVGGETESLMRVLKQAAEANESGDRETVNRMKDHIKGIIEKLNVMEPPAGFGEFHRRLIYFATSIERAIEAVYEDNAGMDSFYTKECYKALMEYFIELKSILIAKGGNPGDIEALENTIIPGLEKILDTQFSGEKNK